MEQFWKIFPCLVVLGSVFLQSAVSNTFADEINTSSGIPELADPLIAESPTPDNGLRFNYFFVDKLDANERIANLEAELAISSYASIEFNVPYTFRDPSDGSGSTDNLDVAELALKVAHGLTGDVIISGGLELGLPTGDDTKGIGSNNKILITPFLGFGAKIGALEAIAFLGFGFPTNQQDPEERADEDLELEYNLAFAYWFMPEARAIVEFDAEMIVKGDDNEGVVNLTLGLIGAPDDNVPLEIGGGVSFPITADKEFDSRVILSLLYEF